MELYQLRTFAAVAETGHLTRAAERLHISQPAVSAQIKALEDKLEVRLFERGPAGMTLTRAGARLLEQAAKVIAAAEELRNLAKALTGESPQAAHWHHRRPGFHSPRGVFKPHRGALSPAGTRVPRGGVPARRSKPSATEPSTRASTSGNSCTPAWPVWGCAR